MVLLHKNVKWGASRSADEWEAIAQQCEDEATGAAHAREESWQRSDTDGALSQWASGIMSRAYSLAAELARAHGKTETRALFFLGTREVASTHRHENRYGHCWVLNDKAAEKFGKRFLSESKAQKPEARAAYYAARGFSVGLVRVTGDVKSFGNSINVSYCIVPDVDALRAGDYEVVSPVGGDPFDWSQGAGGRSRRTAKRGTSGGKGESA